MIMAKYHEMKVFFVKGKTDLSYMLGWFSLIIRLVPRAVELEPKQFWMGPEPKTS